MAYDGQPDEPNEPDIEWCTLCGIRAVERPLFSGPAFAHMREDCNQHICDMCSKHLALAGLRFYWMIDTEPPLRNPRKGST